MTDVTANATTRGEDAVTGLRAAKSASAFRTISEVAGELNVPQHVLRFWETKFNQIKPLKRGGGRRYYRPEDIELLRSIRALLYNDGYTIKGVQKLLRDGGIKSIRNAQPDLGAADSVKERHALPMFPPSPPDNRPVAAPAMSNTSVMANLSPPSTRKSLDPETKASLKALLGELQVLRDLLKK